MNAYRPPRREGAKTYLYRHFDAFGSLLYVGISLSWLMRTKAHSKSAEWFEEVARVTIEQFATREEAMEAEREAIRREKPRYNVVHNRPRVRAKGQRKQIKSKGLGPQGPLSFIAGPCALVGPALVYHENKVSVMVAWGTPGTPGQLTEIVLGELVPDAPDWAYRCASVLLVLGAGDVTIAMAREMRSDIIRTLKSSLAKVEAFDTDIALAVAYADLFPSPKSKQILSEIAA